MTRSARLSLVTLLLTTPATADELILPAPILERGAPVIAIWRPTPPAPGALLLEWTDNLGREVARTTREVDAATLEVALPVDLRRAVAPRNHLVARFVAASGGPERQSSADFLLRPGSAQTSTWNDYQVLMWQDQSPAALAALPALGVTGTALTPRLLQPGSEAVDERLDAGLRFYTENLATDFYAPYHRYTPGRAVTWRFDATRAAHLAAPDDLSVFEREPSLSDPAWLRSVSARLQNIAWRLAPYRPVFHDLADEGGIADLAAAWDFDLTPASLAAMRTWLATRYGGLAPLNHAWGTAFSAWTEVRPALTDAAIQDDRRVPSWMDFKAWMDVAYAQAVRAGAQAVHDGDPNGLAGLEGAQVPGWGGYDYGQLASTVDVMEINDAGNAVEIARSLNPSLRVLTTISVADDAAPQLWHELLLGARGAVLWDDEHQFVTDTGQPGPRSAPLAPLLRTLSGAVGAQLLAARPEPPQVAILYSQASFRLQWLLDRRAAGARWADRDAEAEFTGENAWRTAHRRAAAALAGLGAPARWITPDALGGLTAEGIRILVLPHSLALSDDELAAIRNFAAAGGLIMADTAPGTYDTLGRAREKTPLADLAADGSLIFPTAMTADAGGLAEFAVLLRRAHIARPIECLNEKGEPAPDLDIRLLRDEPIRFYAVQSLTGPRRVTIRFARARPQWAWLFPGTGAYVQLSARTPAENAEGPGEGHLVDLDAAPLILAVSPEEPPHIAVQGPDHAAPGDLVTFRLRPAKPGTTVTSFVQVAVSDPTGKLVPLPAETLRVRSDGLDWHLPLALNDPTGRWTIEFLNATLGDVVTATLDVQ